MAELLETIHMEYNGKLLSSEDIETAIKRYARHQELSKIYSQKNKDKLNERSKNYFKELKKDPERYELYKQKKRTEYHSKKKLKPLKTKNEEREGGRV